MKRTLDRLVEELELVTVSPADVEMVLNEHLRPHLTNLANWSTVASRCIRCKPVVLDFFVDLPYPIKTYTQALSMLRMELDKDRDTWCGELSYYVESSALIIYIEDYNIDTRKSRATGTTIRSIYEAVWKRDEYAFLQTLWREETRLCDFLMDPHNWNGSYCRPFQWSDVLTDSHRGWVHREEIVKRVSEQLGTKTFLISMNGAKNDRASIHKRAEYEKPVKNKKKRKMK